jgi:hypothetical protein
MPLWIEFCPANSEAQFERHVEARGWWRSGVKLNPRKIVNGIAACLDKMENAIKPRCSARNTQRCFGSKAKLDQSSYVGKIKAAESPIVRDVEKD